jgi:hypothetical protein
MAISVTNILHSGTATGATSFVTGSISPKANLLEILAVESNATATANVPTVTGASMTWTQVMTYIDVTSPNTRRITVFRALSPNPGSGALTIDFAGQTNNNCIWSVNECSGIDLSGSNGSGAIVQTASNENSGTQTGITVTLATLSNSLNAAFGFIRKNTATALTKGSNFTELSNDTFGTTTCEAEWAVNQTAVNWTWGSESAVSIAIAIEIKAALGGAFLYNFI